MRQKLLCTLVAMIAGIFMMSADNVMIQVDNPANVKVYTSSKTLDLQAGMNRFTDLTSSESPLTIEAANGAEIVSVTMNQSSTLNPSGDGKYRVGITNMMLDIVTKGSGPVETNVPVTINNSGAPNSFTVKAGDQDIAIGNQVTLASGTEITVIPATGYAIDKVTDLNMATVGSLQADGTYKFNVGSDPIANWYYVYTKVTGISFTIDVDYAPNLSVMLNAQPGAAQEPVTLNNRGITTVVTQESKQPVLFQGANGAEILKVTRNGEELNFMSGYVTGYVSEFAAGDKFVVTTKGKEVDFTFSAANGSAALDAYYFTLADGTALSLTGESQTVKLPLGARVNIAPRPGTSYTTVISSNSGNDWVRVTENGTATIYGTRITGVVINVTDPAQVSVKQSNGYGAALTLKAGENSFKLSDIQNSLQIAPTEGFQILSVAVNGNAVEPGRDGKYLVTVAESSYVDIKSRNIPGKVAVAFTLNDGADYSWLTATLGNEPLELASSVSVTAGSTISVSAAKGYKIDDIATTTQGCNVVKEENGSYTLTVGELSDNAQFAVIVNKITAPEGKVLVTIESSSPFVNYLERTTGSEPTTVGTLDADKVNEVTKGNDIYAYIYTTGVYFKSFKVNGKDYPEAKDKRNFTVNITEDCTLEVETYKKVTVSTQATFNDVAHIQIGDVFVLDATGNPVHSLEAEVGQTLTFKVVPTVGYKLTKLERFYPEPAVEVQNLTYTISEVDGENGMAMFRGQFVEDSEHKSLTIRTQAAFEVEGSTTGDVVGYIYVYTGEGEPSASTPQSEFVTEYVGEIGSKAHLVCMARDDYHLVSFCLSQGFPNSKIAGSYYTIDANDANSEGVIWITGIMAKNGSDSVEGVVADEEGVEYYNIQGVRIAKPAPGQLVIRRQGNTVTKVIAE